VADGSVAAARMATLSWSLLLRRRLGEEAQGDGRSREENRRLAPPIVALVDAPACERRRDDDDDADGTIEAARGDWDVGDGGRDWLVRFLRGGEPFLSLLTSDEGLQQILAESPSLHWRATSKQQTTIHTDARPVLLAIIPNHSSSRSD